MASQVMKPKMPETAIEFEATTKAHLMLDLERFSNGNMSMGIETATVSQDGKPIGSVNLNVGCLVTIHIDGRIWGISPMELFKIGKQADDAYLESLTKPE